MIIKREKIYRKRNGIYNDTVKRTGWWLFGFIPLFINYKIIGRD